MTLALGRHLVDSTIFALVLGMLCFCVRRPGPAARYMLWLIAAVKFAVPIVFLSFLGEKLSHLLAPRRVGLGVPVAISRWITSSPIPEPSAAAKSGFLHPLILIWLIGSAVAFVLWFAKLWASHHVSESTGDFEEQSFLRLKGRIGYQRDARLTYSDDLCEPALVGFWKPVVIIPTGLSTRLSRAELESVILHELAHAKRWDNWTAALAHSVSCVFWFYPLLWWIEKRLHCERELACDEMVVRCGVSSDDYLAGILKVCRLALTGDLAGISGICGSNLKNRMEGIMSLSPDAPSVRTPKVLLGGFAVAIAAVPLLAGFLGVSNAPPAYARSHKGAQAATAKAETQTPITCASASTEYPEGTVIQEGDGPEQMCVKVMIPADASNPDSPLKYLPSWVTTSEAARARSATVVHLPAGRPFFCVPRGPDQKGLCSCEDSGQFSPGARVNSTKGSFQLRCGKDGNWIQTTTPNAERK